MIRRLAGAPVPGITCTLPPRAARATQSGGALVRGDAAADPARNIAMRLKHSSSATRSTWRSTTKPGLSSGRRPPRRSWNDSLERYCLRISDVGHGVCAVERRGLREGRWAPSGAGRRRLAGEGGRASAGGHSRLDPAEGDASRRGSLEVVFDDAFGRALVDSRRHRTRARRRDHKSSQTPPYSPLRRP